MKSDYYIKRTDALAIFCEYCENPLFCDENCYPVHMLEKLPFEIIEEDEEGNKKVR